MSVLEKKLDLIKWLASLENAEAIGAFLRLRDEIEKINADPALQPMSKEELIARAIEANEALENGDVHDVEDLLKKYSEK